AGLRHLMEELHGLAPLVPRELPVPAPGRVRHHPEPAREGVHEVGEAVLELRDLVDRELRVARPADDAVPRNLRLVPQFRHPSAFAFSTASSTIAFAANRAGAEKRIVPGRRNYRTKTINVDTVPTSARAPPVRPTSCRTSDAGS